MRENVNVGMRVGIFSMDKAEQMYSKSLRLLQVILIHVDVFYLKRINCLHLMRIIILVGF